MPIEFRCPNCSSMLRTPDESAGKKAKCPQCGTIADVPTEPGPGATPAPADPFAGLSASGPSASTEPDNPFADAPAAGAAAPENPYASPRAMSTDMAFASGDVPTGELRHQQIDLGVVFSTTWDVFSSNLGTCVLMGVVMAAIAAGMQMVGQFGGMASQASGEIAAVVLFQIFSNVLGFMVQTWMNIGVLYFGIRLARTGQATVGDFFAIGPYFLRGLGINLLIGLICGCLAVLCLLPALGVFIAMGGPNGFQDNPAPVVVAGLIGGLVAAVLLTWISMRVYLGVAFLVDRNTGVVESLSHSDTYMNGNKLTVFLTMLAVSLLGGLFVLVTCCLGIIFFNPYLGVLGAVIYLTATGQPIRRFSKT
jgi:hypothetical protein